MTLHHLGFACRDMKDGLDCLARLYDVTHVSAVVDDELQQATVCMVETRNNLRIELVVGPKVENLVGQGVSLYHTGFAVADIDGAIAELKDAGAGIVSAPKPAPLFGGRLVAFLSTPLGLIELVECPPDMSPETVGRPGASETEGNTIVVAATFTAEPIASVLEFWLREIGKEARVVFAPYGQVFQQLLDENSVLAQNRAGANVLLVRMTDLSRVNTTGAGSSSASQHEAIMSACAEFADSVQTASRRTSVPLIVCLCPSLESDDRKRETALREAEHALFASLSNDHNIQVISHQQLFALYPVEQWSDPIADMLGQIPYSREFFASIGSAVARALYSLDAPRRKVIIVDCDNTLWTGVCGEDGVDGVIIDQHRRDIHRYLLDRYERGMLLCLCSKNNELDVLAVLDRHEMLLRKEHLAAYRINWKPKHDNLRELADEFGLSHDSFVFIDDDPIECAEVRDRCPGIVTIQLPREAGAGLKYLQHVWALDSARSTAEDEKRNRMYKEERHRRVFQQQGFSFQEFYAQLDLVIATEALSAANVARAAQLTQRTNQFNINPSRRSESQLAKLAYSDRHLCRLAHVSDRFGDYGLVGLVILTLEPPLAWTDTFLLSCRALGRGVEHQMLASVAGEASVHGCDTLEIRYIESTRNDPARAFLNEILPPGTELNGRTPVRVTFEHAKSVVFRAGRGHFS